MTCCDPDIAARLRRLADGQDGIAGVAQPLKQRRLSNHAFRARASGSTRRCTDSTGMAPSRHALSSGSRAIPLIAGSRMRARHHPRRVGADRGVHVDQRTPEIQPGCRIHDNPDREHPGPRHHRIGVCPSANSRA